MKNRNQKQTRLTFNNTEQLDVDLHAPGLPVRSEEVALVEKIRSGLYQT